MAPAQHAPPILTITTAEARLLLGYARARIAQEVGGPPAPAPEATSTWATWAARPAATFVTLRWPDRELQGCIGTLEPRRTLLADAAFNAVGAAIADPRARPLTPADVAALTIEISLLSPLEPLAFSDEAGALVGLRPGQDGVVLGWRGRRVTFLPQMWEQFPERAEFLRHLKLKAGMRGDFWAEDIALWRYRVDKHVDDPAAPG